MKKGVFLLMLLGSLFLGGCTTKNIEAQAYAVSLGADLTEDGKMEVSVQVPTLNQGGGSEEGGGSGGGGKGYTFSKASGDTLTEALEMLNAGISRELNLTGVKSIVISERLARSEKFSDALEELALAYRVYGAAELVVCRGRAEEFIKSQQAVIGLRLSESLKVSLAHYRETGNIPSAKAADVYYLSHSIYGDPVAVLAAVGSENPSSAGSDGSSYAGELNQSDDDKNQYFGTALFAGGRMCGMLNGTQTQLLNVLLGELRHFSWVVEGVPMRIEVRGKPRVTVEAEANVPKIRVEISLNVMGAEGEVNQAALKEEMLSELNELTRYAQECGADPFRYAETAAGQFLTVDEWRSYNWREKFPNAQVEYEVRLTHSEL